MELKNLSPTRVHLDNAATWPIFSQALDAMNHAFKNYSNPGGMYKSSVQNAAYLQRARKEFANKWQLTSKQKIIFTSCASESNTIVLKGTSRKTICTKFSHSASLTIPNILAIEQNLEEIEKILEQNQGSIFSISAVQHETGLIAPIKEIYQICKKNYCKLHIDAAQAKKIDSNITKHGDFITISAHKMGGPIGISALITTEPLKPLIFGGMQEESRSGTLPIPLIAGFLESVRVLEENNWFEEHFSQLKQMLLKNLPQAFFLENHKAMQKEKFADYIVCLLTEDIPGSELATFMDLNEIEVAIGSACSTGALEGISVLKSHKFDSNPTSGIRISFSPETQIKHIEQFSEKFKQFMQISIA